jgi:hypothetical protein
MQSRRRILWVALAPVALLAWTFSLESRRAAAAEIVFEDATEAAGLEGLSGGVERGATMTTTAGWTCTSTGSCGGISRAGFNA